MIKLNVKNGLIFISAAGACAFLVFVSLLGENHKIDSVVERFFNDIKSQNYSAACMAISAEKFNDGGSQKEACYNRNFLLELSLLKQFGLLDNNNYDVEIKRGGFWIPYVSEEEVSVNVCFKKHVDKNVIEKLSEISRPKPFIEDLLIVERSNGFWVIKEINIMNSSLAAAYESVKEDVDFNKYIEKNQNGFMLKNEEINMQGLSDTDQRLLRFSLLKVSSLLEKK